MPSNTPYCSPDDARAVGAIGDDPTLTPIILDASRIVDGYCGQSFDLPAVRTILINDVRKLLVTLPQPFTDITVVKLNGGILDPSSYTVEDWGLRLYGLNPFAAGWPTRGSSESGGTWPAQASGAPYGSQLEVTASFGWPAFPSAVVRGTKILTRDLSMPGDGPFAPGQTSQQTGQYKVDFNPNDPHPLDTTGNVEVDRLLTGAGLRRSSVLVA